MWRDVFIALEKVGLTTVIIPFVLAFTIVYALLERLDLFKRDGESFTAANAIIAFVMSFLVIAATNLLSIVNLLSRFFAMGIIFILLFSILIALCGVKMESKTKYIIPVFFAIMALTALYTLYYLGYIYLNLSALLNYITYPAITILVFVLIVWFVISAKTTALPKPSSRDVESEEKEESPEAYKYVKEKSIKKPKEKKRFRFKD